MSGRERRLAREPRPSSAVKRVGEYVCRHGPPGQRARVANVRATLSYAVVTAIEPVSLAVERAPRSVSSRGVRAC